MSAKTQAVLGRSPEQYARLGLKKETVEVWEDGTRTRGGERGAYEWWYFDSHFDDGTSLVIVFYTKSMMSPEGPPAPHATLSLVTADGETYSGRLGYPGVPFRAAPESCDVHIGSCYFTGNLREYNIYFKNNRVQAEIRLLGNLPPWRPETGHIFFGDHDEHYFAWLPAVPEGAVEAAVTLDGKTTWYKGTGYHDHNWGNINMRKILNRWYWGRARIGDYRVISSYIYGEKKYGFPEFPIFMLARGNEIVAGDGGKISFTGGDAFTETKTGKPVFNSLVYDYRDGETRYRISYRRKSSILNFRLIEDIRGLLKLLARIAGFDGAYHRFTGDVTLERFEGDQLVESVEGPAIWELMYFGHVPEGEGS
jgi:hypothetical protein